MVAAAVAFALLLSGATFGHARASIHAAVSCGSVVTTSVTLTADLDCPVTGGIIAGANNIVINLNGHLVEGNNTSNGVGVNGFSGVTIENGTIETFNDGVGANNANNVRIVGLRVTGNATDGIVVSNSPGAVVTTNIVDANANQNITASGVSGTVAITGNRSVGASIGIFMSSVTTANITNNVVNGSSGLGFDLSGITSGSVSGNVSDANGGDGFDIFTAGSQPKPTLTVGHNRAAFNTGLGFDADFVVDGGGNVVQANGNAKECFYISCVAVSS